MAIACWVVVSGVEVLMAGNDWIGSAVVVLLTGVWNKADGAPLSYIQWIQVAMKAQRWHDLERVPRGW